METEEELNYRVKMEDIASLELDTWTASGAYVISITISDIRSSQVCSHVASFIHLHRIYCNNSHVFLDHERSPFPSSRPLF